MNKPLRLQFEARLDYQSRAVDSVVDLFEGQPTQQSLFTVTSWNEKGGHDLPPDPCASFRVS